MFPVGTRSTSYSDSDFFTPTPCCVPRSLESIVGVSPLQSTAGLCGSGSCRPGLRSHHSHFSDLGDSSVSYVAATVPRLCLACSRRAPVVSETLYPLSYLAVGLRSAETRG